MNIPERRFSDKGPSGKIEHVLREGFVLTILIAIWWGALYFGGV